MDKSNEKTNFKPIVDSLFEGMDTFLTTKTVIGEPKVVGETTIIPLMNVSFGIGAGAFANDEHDNGGGGIGGKMVPNGFLIINDGNVRLLRVSQDKNIDRIIELIPEVVSHFKKDKKDNNADDVDDMTDDFDTEE
jgi:uncharacterized spore protein YtfJ